MAAPMVIRSVGSLREHLQQARSRGRKIGFVPTMGDLHEGHLSLIRRAREECDIVVVSDFVNPTQFAPGEDYERYPRDLERDVELCAKEGVDFVFAPSVEEIYPQGFATYVVQERYTQKLCGASRPGHFKGVTTVVAKLFNIVQPDVAYFGQKDAQQAVVVRRMVADLNLPVRIVVCPTVREPDALAMSSRNRYLSPQERRQALCLQRSLNLAKQAIDAGEQSASAVTAKMKGVIEAAASTRLDYAAVVDPETLEDVDVIDKEVLVAVAAWVGKTRLIDNMLISPSRGAR